MEDADEVVDVNASGAFVPLGCMPCDHDELDEWIAVGMPDEWCIGLGYVRQCHGDADGLSETKGNFWVYVADLTTLLSGWGKPYPEVGTDVAADFDHKAETKGKFRVYVNDLAILLDNWGTSAVEPNCP
ncbi:MAG: hypothetical protein ACYSR4_00805 [Planctomycetota bacterium]|jgi:hypothetical protein